MKHGGVNRDGREGRLIRLRRIHGEGLCCDGAQVEQGVYRVGERPRRIGLTKSQKRREWRREALHYSSEMKSQAPES